MTAAQAIARIKEERAKRGLDPDTGRKLTERERVALAAHLKGAA